MNRYPSLLLAACVAAVFALPAQAASPSANAQPQAASVITSAVSPTSPAPGTHSQRPRPASAATRAPQTPVPQGTWSWQNPKPSGNPLYAISCPTTSICYAAGYGWPIQATTNGGTTWTPQGTAQFINWISCASATDCVAVGDSGLVMWTSDGGTNWQSTSVNSGSYLLGVSCPTTLVCVATGYAGSTLRSVDGGAHWGPQASGTTNDLWSVSCPSTTFCVAVGDNATFTRTTNGISWSAGTFFDAGNYFGVSCSTTLDCTAVEDNGPSPVTYDGGATWSNYINLPGPTRALTSISCTSATQCFATGVDGNAYVDSPCPPQNFVGCWEATSTGETGALYAISCQSATLCFVAGDYGIIAKTTNGASGWTKQSPNAFPVMDAVSCPSTSVCFVAGQSGTVVATTNGAASWSTQVPSADSSSALRSISCPTATTCFVVGDAGIVFATSDGGAHWTAQTSALASGLSSISCPSATVCFAVGGNGVILATIDGGTNWASQASGTTQALRGISCPTTSICYALGYLTTSLGTVDGGAHWAAQGTLAANMGAISCPSATTCFATGNNNQQISVTTDSGTTWNATTAPLGYYAGISCASTTVCVAVSLNSAVSTADGTTWSSQSAPGELFGVSCPSATTCIGGGDMLVHGTVYGGIAETTDGSVTPWILVAPTGTTDDVQSVSCPSTSTCFAVTNVLNGSSVVHTTNGGSVWTAVLSSDSHYGRISCPSTSDCFAVGVADPSGLPIVTATTDGGAHWTEQVVQGGSTSISCPTVTTCFAINDVGSFIKTVDGTSWSVPQTVTAERFASAISCPSTTVCFAAGGGSTGQIAETSNGGASWALSFDVISDPNATSYGDFHAIDCPSITTCYAAGYGGLVAATSDGGATWRTDNTQTSETLTGISCPTSTTCYASGSDSNILLSTNGGGDWSAQAPVVQATNAINCPSTTACFAVGNGGVITATTSAGAAWTVLRPSDSTADINSMSCYGSSNCYAAAGDTLFASHDGGANWASTTLPGTDQLDSISCPGANTCFAVGWPGAIVATTDGGTSWNAQANPLLGSDQTLLGISCASVTLCVAVGTGGNVLSTSNGTSWSHETSGTTGTLWAVSCPSTSSCVAVGRGGTLTRTGSSWHIYSSGTTQTLLGVNCPTVNTCYAVGTAGVIRVTTNRGVTWAARTSGTTENLFGIACLQPSYCVADGDFGTVLVTVDGASWKSRATPNLNTLRAAAFPDLNHSWLAGFGGTILANPSLIPSCTSVSIAADQSSPQPIGTVITLSAAAAGCPDPNPSYRFYLRSPSGVWSIVQNFSTSNSFVWNTASYVPGTYLMGVWAKDTKSGFTYDAYAFGTFTLQHLPCTSVNVASDAASPQASGITVNFTASSLGCPSPQYQWWVRNAASVWSIVVPFASSTDTFAWNTTGLVDGTYQIGVWARQAGSTKSHEAFVFVTFTVTPTITGTTHCGAVDVAASPASPQVKTTSVTLTASVFGCDTPQYKWWVRDTAAVWHVVQNYPGTSTFVWAGTRPAGTYLLGVWVRQSGSTAAYEAYSFITYTLVVAPTNACTSVNIAPDVTSPQAPGTVVTFTAAALGCPSATYKFFVAPPNGTFGEVQAFGASNTFIWNTAGLSPGPWQIGVWARQSGSTSAYQAFAFITYQLTFG